MGDLANAYLRLRRLDQADEWYRRALRATVAPPRGDWYIGLGLVASQQADFATAQAQFERAIAANPSSARAYYNVGLALLSQNQLAEADSALVAAIKRDRDIAPAYFARGRIAMRRKDWARALPLLEHAISGQPQEASYLYALSQVQFRLQMTEAGRRSLAQFRQARARFFYEEGHALLSRSAWKDALGWLERALALEPALAEALRDRAHCLLQLGDAEGARRGYEAVLRRDPTSVHATY
jgi:tetratricopeptide (TPR) repeat protein